MQYENKIFFIWENDILPSFYNLYEKAEQKERMDAKGMRQYVVTEYALLDVSACEHELFYKRS